MLQGYALLQEVMGEDAVESLDAFRGTVSPAVDVEVRPKLVGATLQESMIGFAVGAYLRPLNSGFMAYSAVRKAWRGGGIYTAMRDLLLRLFNQEAAKGGSQPRAGGDGANRRPVDYVISELAENSRLYARYLREWDAIVLPCAYEQPKVQGLQARDLKLVVQPIGKTAPPETSEVLTIVREIYERVYRIPDAAESRAFHRVAASLIDTSGSMRQWVSP
jgi:hypothetical protein